MLDPQQYSGVEAAALGRLTHILRREHLAGHREDYRAERQLKIKFEVSGYDIFLTGRIDGLWHEADVTVIEEVKTVFSGFESSPKPSHRMQCAIYIWMYNRMTGEKTIGCLTRINATNGLVNEHEIHPDLSILETEVRNRISSIITFLETENIRLSKRAESVDEVNWIYRDYRPGQVEIIDAVSTAIASDRNLVLEAAAGSGKTAPILFAALKECCLSHDRLAFSTSRTSQQGAKVKLLEQFAPASARGRSLLLTANDKLCPNHNIECPSDPQKSVPLEPWSTPRWLDKLLVQEKGITSKDIQTVALEKNLCAILLQREVARRCDILIGDHNLLGDPNYQPTGWFSKIPGARKTVLLLDEAHGLPDRLRDRRSTSLSLRMIRNVVDSFNEQDDPVRNELTALLIELYDRCSLILAPVNEESEYTPFEVFDVTHRGLKDIIHQLVDIYFQESLFETEELTSKLFYNLHLIGLALEEPKAYVAWMNRQESLLCWTLFNPGQLLQEKWRATRSTIAFSATLSPWSISQSELGFPSDTTDFLKLPYPFPEENRLILRFIGIDTSYRKRMGSVPFLAKMLSDFPLATNGDWIIFFPSHEYLRMCLPFLKQLNVPAYHDHDSSTSNLMKESETSKVKHGLYLHVLGGKSSEGVEWNDMNLSGVAVISPGIPPISPERELMKHIWNETTGDGFFRVYLYPAIIKTIQATGRLIRDEHKAGIILLVGERFGNDDWESTFPEEWQYAEKHSEGDSLRERITTWWQYVAS